MAATSELDSEARASYAPAIMIRHLLPVPALLILTPVAAWAQEAPSDVVTLTPAAREAALESAGRRSDALPINGLGRDVHGEVGVEVGSKGSRAAYGTASVPLGDTGRATVSFLDSRSDRWPQSR